MLKVVFTDPYSPFVHEAGCRINHSHKRTVSLKSGEEGMVEDSIQIQIEEARAASPDPDIHIHTEE